MSHRVDMCGKIFGKLTVMSRHNSFGKNSRWICKCDCGKTIIVSLPNLKRGQKSCGCIPNIPKPTPIKNDLQGNKYNLLLAIRPLGGKQSYWSCLCECGKEIKVQKKDLLRNKIKSCGCKKPEHHITNIDDFLKKVQKTDSCWIWIGSIREKSGYGQIGINKKNVSAHRASWIFHRGKIPVDKIICHTCDNRKCVNPNHLYLGTHQTNAIDRYSRKTKKELSYV